jgi:hypothetical protein
VLEVVHELVWGEPLEDAVHPEKLMTREEVLEVPKNVS